MIPRRCRTPVTHRPSLAAPSRSRECSGAARLVPPSPTAQLLPPSLWRTPESRFDYRPVAIPFRMGWPAAPLVHRCTCLPNFSNPPSAAALPPPTLPTDSSLFRSIAPFLLGVSADFHGGFDFLHVIARWRARLVCLAPPAD